MLTTSSFPRRQVSLSIEMPPKGSGKAQRQQRTAAASAARQKNKTPGANATSLSDAPLDAPLREVQPTMQQPGVMGGGVGQARPVGRRARRCFAAQLAACCRFEQDDICNEAATRNRSR